MTEVKSAEGDDEFSGKTEADRSISLTRVPEEEADFGMKRKIETLAEKNGAVPPESDERLEEAEEAAASSKRHKSDEKNGSSPQEEDHLQGGDALVEEKDNGDDEEEEADDDDEEYNTEQDGDDDEGKRRADIKGKEIAVDRKGKGKMVGDSEDEDSDCQNVSDDDSSDDSDGDFSDELDDSDVEDDPLAEVDLNNILPSRTRRSKAPAGFRINDRSEDV